MKEKHFKLLISLLSFTFTHFSIAQPSFPPPSGVYCSCGPTTGIGSGSVAPAVAAKPFVKGILVRVAWDLMEPADNIYNWTLIDGQISAAKSYNKKISLGIGCGIHIPQWVFNSGAQRLVSSVPFNDTIAVPWDSVFLNKWTGFITALGNHYQNDTTITLVYMTASTGNGFEMELPFVTTPTLSIAGYSDTKMIKSWKTIIDAFNSAFPNHFLTNDFHPVNGSNTVADSVYAYAVSTIGSRYGANAWWWTQNNTTVYPSQYTIIRNSASSNNFTGIQMAYSGTTNPNSFGTGGMPAALQLAITNGICYWEVWNNDILNNAFDSLLANASCSITTNVVTEKSTENNFEIYPNPASDKLIISFSNRKTFTLKILNSIGQEVSDQIFSKNLKTETIDISKLQTGIYFVKAITDDQEVFNQKIIISR